VDVAREDGLDFVSDGPHLLEQMGVLISFLDGDGGLLEEGDNSLENLYEGGEVIVYL
jgi:hypothetical protein